MAKSLMHLLLEQFERLGIQYIHDEWEDDGIHFLRIRSEEKGERQLTMEFIFNEKGDQIKDIELLEEIRDSIISYKVNQPGKEDSNG